MGLDASRTPHVEGKYDFFTPERKEQLRLKVEARRGPLEFSLVAGLFAENESLQAERGQWKSAAERMDGVADRLQAEVERLRAAVERFLVESEREFGHLPDRLANGPDPFDRAEGELRAVLDGR